MVRLGRPRALHILEIGDRTDLGADRMSGSVIRHRANLGSSLFVAAPIHNGEL